MSCKATSRLKRASLTCALAGFGAAAEVDRDLLEWNYGSYDGRTRDDIHAERPDWLLFRDGYPGGEMPAEVAARADRVVSSVRAVPGTCWCSRAAFRLPCVTHF